MPTNKRSLDPCTVADFLNIFLRYWYAPDQPPRYIAYLRAEAELEAATGKRKYKTFKSFDTSARRYQKTLQYARKNTKKHRTIGV